MENEARHDLNAAIETWRQELLAQPGLTPDDRRELETHLRDTIVELQGRGLNDEESFWLARQRAGPPAQIAGEFAKADPARVWRGRVMWMAAAVLFMNVWSHASWLFVAAIWIIIHNYPWPETLPLWNVEWDQGPHSWFQGYLVYYYVTLLCVAVGVSGGGLTKMTPWVRSIFNSRARFVMVAALTVSGVYLLQNTVSLRSMEQFSHPPGPFAPAEKLSISIGFLSPVLWDFTLIGLIAWLMPVQQSKTPQPA